MPTSIQKLAYTLAAFGLLLLGSCGSPSTGGPQTVSVEFENEVHGGHRRFFVLEGLGMRSEAPNYYDLRLESDRPAGMWISANGTRNLALVGTGDEAAFRQLAKAFDPWSVRGLPAAAKTAGIAPGPDPADYWTPGEHIVKAGAIIALRQMAPPAFEGGEDVPRDVAALVYVQSISGKQKLVLLVARAP